MGVGSATLRNSTPTREPTRPSAPRPGETLPRCLAASETRTCSWQRVIIHFNIHSHCPVESLRGLVPHTAIITCISPSPPARSTVFCAEPSCSRCKGRGPSSRSIESICSSAHHRWTCLLRVPQEPHAPASTSASASSPSWRRWRHARDRTAHHFSSDTLQRKPRQTSSRPRPNPIRLKLVPTNTATMALAGRSVERSTFIIMAHYVPHPAQTPYSGCASFHWPISPRSAKFGKSFLFASLRRRREFRHSAAPPSSFSRRFNTDGRGASAEWQSRRWLGQPGVGDRVGLLVPQPLRDLLALVGLAARRADLPKSGTKEMMQTAV